jgi:hypothetical protein
MHHIRTEAVNDLILETIQRATAYARKYESDFVKIICETSVIQQGESAKLHKQLIAKNERRIAELDTLFKRTYEDFAVGRLTEKRFTQLSNDYETEQTILEHQTAELKSAMVQFDSNSLRADKFLDLAKKYTTFTELTPAIIHEFVDKVIVHEADKSSGTRMQRVDIYLNFIGQFSLPQ